VDLHGKKLLRVKVHLSFSGSERRGPGAGHPHLP
jgi:hypothetical protein